MEKKIIQENKEQENVVSTIDEIKTEESIPKKDEDKIEVDDIDNINELREQARIKAEKKQQKIREKEIKSGKKCRIAGIIAAVSGVLEVYFGFSASSSSTMCIGVAFICAGYFYYNMGKRLDRKHNVS